MFDSVRPHRRQPTRLPCPWDSPGKNTGVGCHFLFQCRKVKSESEVTQLCPTLSNPMDCSLPGSSIHGIFQARVLEWVAIVFSGVHAYLLTKWGEEVDWQLHQWLPSFPWTIRDQNELRKYSTPICFMMLHDASTLGPGLSYVTQIAQTWSSLQAGSPHWHINRQFIKHLLGTALQLDNHSLCPDSGQVPTPALLDPGPLPCGIRVMVLGGWESIHSEERSQHRLDP